MTDFEKHVIDALAELRTDTAHIRDHLTRLNGKVAAHEAAIGQMQIDMARHQVSCPMMMALAARVDPLEVYVTAQKATAIANGKWVTRIEVDPVFWTGGIL